ncbi:MAG: LAGLIDADG family homing endonuclease [Promethearchaeota archaeon]
MKFYKDENWLRKEYVDKRRHVNDIGEQCGAAGRTVATWVKKFGLKRRRFGSYNVDDSFFECIDTEKKAYWLGFVAADGCVMNRPGKRILTVCLASKDRNHLEQFRRDIQCEKEVHVRKDGNVQFDVCSDKLVADLIRYGVHPRKSKTLKAPELREDLVRHWIRGYFDGDGCVSIDKKGNTRGEFFGTRDVIEFVVEHLPSKSSACERAYKGGWDCGFGGNGVAKKVADFLYEGASVFLDRKHAVFQKGCVS